MKRFYSALLNAIRCTSILFFIFIHPEFARAQSSITDYALFGGNNACPLGAGQKTPTAPGCGVIVGNGSKIFNGAIGSYGLVQGSNNIDIGGSIYSGGRVIFSNYDTVAGRITAANTSSATGNILLFGTNARLNGNIDGYGKISVALPGVVSGKVTYPATGGSYAGPSPAGGQAASLTLAGLPQLPSMPPITTFPAVGTVNINSTQTLLPGSYGNLTLLGGQTITFAGPGVYVFKSIRNTGLAINNFNFDFQGTSSGAIKIYVYGDVDVNILNEKFVNGGDASRIFLETHGTGTSCSFGSFAFTITNYLLLGRTSQWYGTVWAPYAGINIGSNTMTSTITGAMWSGTQVNVQCGVKFSFVPFIFSLPFYPPPANGKLTTSIIGSELNSLYANYGVVTDDAKTIFILDPNNQTVQIEVISKSGKTDSISTLRDSLAFYGFVETTTNGLNKMILTGTFPIRNLKFLDINPISKWIDYVRPLYPPLHNGSFLPNQADAVIHSDLARGGYNLSGKGIKVGVISDSYNNQGGATNDIQNGVLPGAANPDPDVDMKTEVELVKDYPPPFKASDEGRAMLELVHGIAPKAALAFRTGYISSGDFAQGIIDLKNNSACDVIVDDVTYITEPFFQDGTITMAVDSVTKLGVSYFTSAGNSGMASYGGTFTPTTVPAGMTGTAHDFGGGAKYQPITIQPNQPYTIVLQWDDPFYSVGGGAGAKNDLDIYLTNDNGATLYGFNRNSIGADPLEIMPFTMTGTGPINTNILVVRAPGSTGTGPIRFKYIVFRGKISINSFNQGNSTIVGQANAANAITIGAVNYVSQAAEAFTSQGGPLVLESDTKHKPDFVAPDGLSTTVFLGNPPTGGSSFPAFYGTSCAAPVAAGVAALLMEGKKKFTGTVLQPADLRLLLKQTAIQPSGIPGFNSTTGNGLIQAYSAMNTFAAPAPVVTALALVPDPSKKLGVDDVTVTVNGNFLVGQSTVQFRGQDLTSTQIVNPTQATATIPPFTGNPPITVFTKSIQTTPCTGCTPDGGTSAPLYFYTPTKKDIIINVNNSTKKYGEKLPQFSSIITIDGLSLDAYNTANNTTLTLAQLRLDDLTYSTFATSTSDVGQYLVTVAQRVPWDNTVDLDEGLQETYNYKFNFTSGTGVLNITKMPLLVTPVNETHAYGDNITDFDYTYSYSQENILANEQDAFLQNIKLSHQSNLAQNIYALVTAKSSLANNISPLTLADLNNLSMMASSNSLTSAKSSLANSKSSLANSFEIDIPAQTILNFNADGSSATFVNGASAALFSAKSSLANNMHLNGTTITNSSGSILNSSNVSDDKSDRIAIIVNDADQAAGSFSGLKSLNLVTGVTVGANIIVPGAFLSNNFDVTYGLGTLTITPAPLTVKTQDAIPFTYGDYGLGLPDFKDDITGLQYADVLTDVVSSPATHSLKNKITNAAAATPIGAGSYNIIPSALGLTATPDVPSNYYVPDMNYLSGNLTVNKATLPAQAQQDASRIFGNANPDFNILYGPFKYSTETASLIKIKQGTSTPAMIDSPPGTYPVTLAAIAPADAELYADNYYILNSQTPGTLTILPAPLTITADNKSRAYGLANPPLTVSYAATNSSLQPNSQLVALITTPTSGLPAATTSAANVTAPAGLYPIVPTPGTSVNYAPINFVSGTLSISPVPLTVKADDKYINDDDNLPSFTSTYSGFVGTDNKTILCSPSYSVSPVYKKGFPGLYTITPYNLQLKYAGNYIITYLTGNLYVTDNHGKSVVPSLECVEIPSGTSTSYIAHFSYNNPNAYTVYVPAGSVNNRITNSGSATYNSQLPTAFAPGKGQFKVYFDGTKITWTLATYNNYYCSPITAVASSTSTKCYKTSVTSTGDEAGHAVSGQAVEEESATFDPISSVYPNPARDMVTLHEKTGILSPDQVQIIDTYGRILAGKAKRLDDHSIQVSLGNLTSGVYVIMAKVDNKYKNFRVVKE